MSPTFHHPAGPPPPYSQSSLSQTTSWSNSKPDSHVSDSRRTSGDEYEGPKLNSRQSLPSISEALGVDGQTSYPSSTSVVPAPSSPPPTARKSYGMESSQFNNATYENNTAGQYRSFRQDSAGPPSFPPIDAPKSGYASSQDSRSEFRPPLHVQTSQYARQEALDKPYQRAASPAYEKPSSYSGSSMGPPSSTTYGYAPYPPRYAEPTPPSSHSAGPIYQPSAQYGPPSQGRSSGWKSDSASSRFVADDRSTSSSNYGDSVKRHLEQYDLEAALNDVSSLLCSRV